MKLLGLIGVPGCLALGLPLLSAMGTVPFGISGAAAGAGPEAVNRDEPSAVSETSADAPKKRRGPPPLVHTEFLEVCASCHKFDGRGGRSYGGYAANLHLTELEYDGLVYVILNGIPENGMPSFEGVFGARNIDAVATYILENFKGKPVAEERQAHSGK